jgi:hypothetical protein
MSTLNKFNIFVQDLGQKVHNLNADTLKVMLTDTAPVATNTVKANITEIAAGNGYSAGGATVGTTAYSQASGTATLTGANVVFTASGGAIGQFRYAVLYNSTPVNGNLIGWVDYGAEVNITSGNTFTVEWNNGTNSNILTVT